MLTQKHVDELVNVKTHLHPFHKEKLKTALFEGKLNFTSSTADIFGSIFGNNNNNNARSFKSNTGISTSDLESVINSQPDIGYAVVAYLCDQSNLDSVKSYIKEITLSDSNIKSLTSSELAKFGLVRLSEVKSGGKIKEDDARRLVDRMLSKYTAAYVEQFMPEVWSMKKDLGI